MKMEMLEIESNRIFLGWIENDDKFSKLTLCASLSEEKMINLEDLTTYPKSDYKIERGIIHYYPIRLTKIINLSYLLRIFGYKKMNYEEINQVMKKLNSQFILDLLEQKKDSIDLKTVTYLKEIYHLLQMNEDHQEIKIKNYVKGI